MLAILQVAIGLIFIFSLLSILVTTVNSIVVNLLKTRTRYLKLGVNSLLTDPELQAAFISHPLVKLVRAPMLMPGSLASAAQAQQAAVTMNAADLTQLSWITPKMFADVLISLLTEKSELTLYGTLLITTDALPAGRQRERILDLVFGVQSTGLGLDELRAAIAGLPLDLQPNFLTALAPIEARLESIDDYPGQTELLPLLDGVRKVNDETFRRAMKVIVGTANNLNTAQRQIESWFDARMDQLSELFKKRMTVYSIVVGIVMVAVLNVDTLHIGRTLWEEPTRRAAVTAAAEQAIADGALTLPDTAPDVTVDATAQASSAGPDLSSVETFQTTLDALLSLDVPLGWAFLPVEGGCFIEGNAGDAGAGDLALPAGCTSALNLWAHVPGNSPEWGGLFLRKLIGCILTVIAVAQGAPFWFDLLNRLVRGR